jgi:hypothetical protein
MQNVNILLWINGAGDWAIEEDGSRYERLSPSTIHLLNPENRFTFQKAELGSRRDLA